MTKNWPGYGLNTINLTLDCQRLVLITIDHGDRLSRSAIQSERRSGVSLHLTLQCPPFSSFRLVELLKGVAQKEKEAHESIERLSNIRRLDEC